MALSRRALFGFPPPQPPSSVHTVRLVPLTQGVNQDTAWPLLAPGSAQSMTNFLPLNGKLAPRSRLSSINTIAIPNGAGGEGMAELNFGVADGLGSIWLSGSTLHAIVASNGSISRASFVSSFGLGHADLELQSRWQYTPAFSGTIGSDGGYMLVAAGGGSHDTLLCLYQSLGISGPPQYSYLTSAPKALAVGGIDSYIVAFNIDGGGAFFGNRIQWCVRGEPSNWTGEGAGFEDLLDMRGSGTAARPMSDGRLVLFTDREIWYGLRATYPAQFQFYPLDNETGCRYPQTIADTSAGLIFLGTDWHLRLLPTGGGPSRILAPQVAEYLRARNVSFAGIYGVYDPITQLYHLFFTNGDLSLVINTVTGEVGFMEYADVFPATGIALGGAQAQAFSRSEGLLFASSTVVFSTNSLISLDTSFGSGSAVTSTWRSAPIAADLAGDWKQLTDINVDYRATSASTLTIRVAADGNTYESTGRSLSLASAPVAGRAQSQVYTGGAFPAIEVQSSSTGYTLHRIDVGMNIGGRRS
jgi:hypothetical protein